MRHIGHGARVGLGAILLLAIAACGDEGGESSDVDLVAVAERSGTVPHRFAVWASLDGEPDTSGEAMVLGEQDGSALALRADMTPIIRDFFAAAGESAAPGLPEDMTMEVAYDEDNIYLRAPFMAEAAGRSDDELSSAFADWVYVDATRLSGAGREAVEGIIGDGGIDPAEVIQGITTAEDPRDQGSGEVRGTTMSEITAEVSAADLANLLDTNSTGATDVMIEVSIWIDSAERLGRISYDLYMEALAEADTELDGDQREQMSDALSGVELSIIMDFFDYDDPDIEVEFPDDATDLTDELDH